MHSSCAPGSASASSIEQPTSVVAEMTKVMMGRQRTAAAAWLGETDTEPAADGTVREASDRHLMASANKIRDLSCKHGHCDQDGKPWPTRSEKRKEIAVANHVDPDSLEDIGRTMDGTLFRDNKDGWDDSWKYLLENHQDFEYIFMNTNGGYRGFEVTCVHCQCSCTLSWNKNSGEEVLERNRAKWLSFLLQTSLPSTASKPIV
jgi:hypothetical protein